MARFLSIGVAHSASFDSPGSHAAALLPAWQANVHEWQAQR